MDGLATAGPCCFPPADYTPVCTTELGAFAQRKGEFDKRDVKLSECSGEGPMQAGCPIIEAVVKNDIAAPRIACKPLILKA